VMCWGGQSVGAVDGDSSRKVKVKVKVKVEQFQMPVSLAFRKASGLRQYRRAPSHRMKKLSMRIERGQGGKMMGGKDRERISSMQYIRIIDPKVEPISFSCPVFLPRAPICVWCRCHDLHHPPCRRNFYRKVVPPGGIPRLISHGWFER